MADCLKQRAQLVCSFSMATCGTMRAVTQAVKPVVSQSLPPVCLRPQWLGPPAQASTHPVTHYLSKTIPYSNCFFVLLSPRPFPITMRDLHVMQRHYSPHKTPLLLLFFFFRVKLSTRLGILAGHHRWWLGIESESFELFEPPPL